MRQGKASGQSLTEYGLAMALIAVVSITALKALGGSVNTMLQSLSDQIASVSATGASSDGLSGNSNGFNSQPGPDGEALASGGGSSSGSNGDGNSALGGGGSALLNTISIPTSDMPTTGIGTTARVSTNSSGSTEAPRVIGVAGYPGPTPTIAPVSETSGSSTHATTGNAGNTRRTTQHNTNTRQSVNHTTQNQRGSSGGNSRTVSKPIIKPTKPTQVAGSMARKMPPRHHP